MQALCRERTIVRDEIYHSLQVEVLKRLLEITHQGLENRFNTRNRHQLLDSGSYIFTV